MVDVTVGRHISVWETCRICVNNRKFWGMGEIVAVVEYEIWGRRIKKY
jgi:hypothetical protein